MLRYRTAGKVEFISKYRSVLRGHRHLVGSCFFYFALTKTDNLTRNKGCFRKIRSHREIQHFFISLRQKQDSFAPASHLHNQHGDGSSDELSGHQAAHHEVQCVRPRHPGDQGADEYSRKQGPAVFQYRDQVGVAAVLGRLIVGNEKAVEHISGQGQEEDAKGSLRC